MVHLKTPDQPQDFEYSTRLREHYAPLITKHGNSFRAVDWGTSNGQNLRFEILLSVIDYRSLRILDLGCGLGHLAQYLNDNNFKGSYLGVDLVPEMVNKAKALHKNFQFELIQSLVDVESYKPDLVIASGIFTFATESYFYNYVPKMYALAGTALAFNALSSLASNKQKNELYLDPEKTFSFCSTITNKLALRHDYMPHDFSIYLYK